MALTPNDLRKKVAQYLKTPEGKKLLKENALSEGSAYSEESMVKIAKRLRDDIIAAYQEAIDDKSVYATIDVNRDTSYYTSPMPNKKMRVRIVFRDDALRRPSLYTRNWVSTGSGVYDIFGLLTQGYSASNYAYGIWVHNDGDDITDEGSTGIIRSMKARKGNDFINRIINRYQSIFPDVEFRWPSAWGGND